MIKAKIETVGDLSHMEPQDLPTKPAMIIVFDSREDCKQGLMHPEQIQVMAWPSEVPE